MTAQDIQLTRSSFASLFYIVLLMSTPRYQDLVDDTCLQIRCL